MTGNQEPPSERQSVERRNEATGPLFSPQQLALLDEAHRLIMEALRLMEDLQSSSRPPAGTARVWTQLRARDVNPWN